MPELGLIYSFVHLLTLPPPPSSYGIPRLSHRLRLLLLGPKTRTDAQVHHEEHHEQRRGPRPARGCPRVGMITEHRDKRLEEVRLDRVMQILAVAQVLTVQDEEVGASGGIVRFVEALAFRAGGARSVGVIEDARAPTVVVAGAEHVGTDAAEPVEDVHGQ